MEIVVAFVLLLYADGKIIEHTGPFTISECLSVKREIKRNGWKDRNQTRYACEQRKIQIGEDWQGEKIVTSIIE